ncbi:hypothetical protein BDW68DRAFT_183107 [Aspergillus falconensis]
MLNLRAVTFYQHIPVSSYPDMLPVSHADNFKTWTPPSRTRSSSKRSRPHPPFHESPAIRFPQSPLPQVLPLPKHQLPARRPAEVCVHASAVTPSATSQGPQSPSKKSSRLRSATTPATTPTTSSDLPYVERLEQSLRSGAIPSSNLDLSMPREVHNAIDPSIDALFFPEDALTCISSPSVSSSDESWQEFLLPADEQNGVPIDPVILTNNGPWETEDERQHIHADGYAFISETICQYPGPPPLLLDTRDENRNSNAIVSYTQKPPENAVAPAPQEHEDPRIINTQIYYGARKKTTSMMFRTALAIRSISMEFAGFQYYQRGYSRVAR